MYSGVVFVRLFEDGSASQTSQIRRAHELGLPGVRARLDHDGRVLSLTATSVKVPVTLDGQPVGLFRPVVVRPGQSFQVNGTRCVVEWVRFGGRPPDNRTQQPERRGAWQHGQKYQPSPLRDQQPRYVGQGRQQQRRSGSMSRNSTVYVGPVKVLVKIGKGNTRMLHPDQVQLHGANLKALGDGRVLLRSQFASPVVNGRSIPPAQNRTLSVGDRFSVGDAQCQVVREERASA